MGLAALRKLPLASDEADPASNPWERGFFAYFSPQNWLDHNGVVFRAASVVDPNQKSVNGKRGIYGWFAVDWNHPDKSLGDERLRTLADGSSVVPLLGEAKFDDFRSAPSK